MSKGKRRRHRAKPVTQTQSPARSSPSPATKPTRRHDNQHKAKKRLPSSSKTCKNHGLDSESPQAGSSNRPVTDHERTKPGSFNSSQAKVQEPGPSRKRSPKSLQRTRPPRVKMVDEYYQSDFEFEYKDQAQLKSRLALRSPPSSPQKGVGLKNATRVSNHDRQHKPREAPLLNSTQESQSVLTHESDGQLVLPSPALPGRSLGRKRTTPISRPDYGQQTCESSTSDTNNESELSSESGPDSGPEPSFSPSPCVTTALKRNRSNAHHASRRQAVPFSAPSSPDSLPEVESEPILPLERAWSIVSSLGRLTYSEPTTQSFRSEHRRKACDTRKPPSPSSSVLVSMIGSESPSKSVAPSEYHPAESEPESRDISPSPTAITLPSSPPVPPAASRVRSRVRSQVLSPVLSPQRWLPRLERPDQESSLIRTVWTSRLRHKCDINPPEVPLMIDGKRYPRLFKEFPLAAHENIDFMFSDDSDDPDFDLPEAKRRKLCLLGNSPEPEESADREESSSAPQVPSNPEESSEPEQSAELESEPNRLLDLGPLLDAAIPSNPEPSPELERSSDPERSSGPESEHPGTPTSIRDEVTVRSSRQLNRQIDKAVEIDKERNPKYWGGSWMKELARGSEIKERVEAEYEREMEREKKEREERKMQKERDEREARKKTEEEQERQKQKERRKREEFGKPKSLISELKEMLDEEERGTTGAQIRPELKGNQSIAQMQRMQKMLERHIERVREQERETGGV
ncbi:hypothetical protein N7471_002254 [Penicillium samsonianum]|uniref:uncharacterized protein n=1 Tax=Penicillium samsonianum TaxID=1882272 RepID=UPI002548CCB4|nr:uncharacterized protein N7471_002254 [Penicillium samsonianum]KAJ6142801.1 hypothetical protein N7471_002254 [Penicillium samsonianum]